MKHIFGKENRISEQRQLTDKIKFDMKHLETLEGFVNVNKAISLTELRIKRAMWPLRRDT